MKHTQILYKNNIAEWAVILITSLTVACQMWYTASVLKRSGTEVEVELWARR
jgi:hypothetical protein